MDIDEYVRRRIEATEEFNCHERRGDGVQVASSLSEGLTLLRDAFLARVQDDVERSMGKDSMLTPVSREKSERITRMETEIYQISVSSVTAWNREYITTRDNWYSQWLDRLRLGPLYNQPEVMDRLECYLSKTANARRLTFTNVMAHAMATSSRAPLVLFRLHPLAVEIVTALAFGDHVGARKLRKEQMVELPVIHDCHPCRGKLLENGEQCRACGNPLWKYDWLLMTA